MTDKEEIKTEYNEQWLYTEGIHPFLQRPRSACRLGRRTFKMVVFRFGCRWRAQRPVSTTHIIKNRKIKT